jgi:DNA-damage-inducible protein J
MPSNTVVQTRIDSVIKEEATAVLATMGLTVSDAVRLLLTHVAHDRTLPSDLLVPNTQTVAAMKDVRAGRNLEATSLEQLRGEIGVQ